MWHSDDGWGVLDSVETPGGCWVHFSALRIADYRSAVPGQRVAFTYERAGQDGFDYRALDVTIASVPRCESENEPPGLGYRSYLQIER